MVCDTVVLFCIKMLKLTSVCCLFNPIYTVTSTVIQFFLAKHYFFFFSKALLEEQLRITEISLTMLLPTKYLKYSSGKHTLSHFCSCCYTKFLLVRVIFSHLLLAVAARQSLSTSYLLIFSVSSCFYTIYWQVIFSFFLLAVAALKRFSQYELLFLLAVVVIHFYWQEFFLLAVVAI